MQERKYVKIPSGLEGKVFFDVANKVLYIEGNYLKKDGVFLTFVKELIGLYGNFKIVEDVNFLKEKEKEKNLKDQVFTLEQTVLSTWASILKTAAEKRVSDIHLEIKDGKCEVFFRKEGNLYPFQRYDAQMGELMVSSLYNNAEGQSHQSMSVTEFQYAQVGRDKPFMPQELEAIRIHRGPIMGGQYMVMRLFYRTASLGIRQGKNFEETVYLTLKNYGYKSDTIKKAKMAIESGDGIILVAGPTGSGKSTALKLFLELVHILYPHKSIFTIENPPEYTIQGAKQLAVPQFEGWSFERVLREALRSDPDVIMIGEIRETDTAKAAFQAALTGHQVFSTVHARNISSIIERIKGLGLELGELIKNNIARLFVAQRLVPALCPHCKTEKQTFEDIEGYFSKGCEKCEYTGIKGRVIIEEALSFKEFETLGDDIEEMERYLLEKGASMMVKGLRLVFEGKISPLVLVSTLGYWKREEVERALEE